jgi:flagellar biosynthesis/type III secretory pathway chaperone
MTVQQISTPTVTIDGVVHEIDSLSDQHKVVMGHVQVADQEIAKLQNLIAILTTGRQAYINELGKELNGKDQEFTDDASGD